MKKTTFLLPVGLLFVLMYLCVFLLGKTNSPFVCRNPYVANNRGICEFAGCNWGAGDLTGPPFCGAYK